jgi:predicted HicB family RNase H-like nuclease
MPFRIIADSLTDLPEGLRDAAKQNGDKFVVEALKEGWAVEDIAALKNAHERVLKERNQYRDTLKHFDGIDPAKAAEAREALESVKAGKVSGNKELEEYRKSVEAKMAEERARLEGKLNARTAALRERMVKGELAPAIAKLGGAESMDAIMTLAQQYIRVEEDDAGNLKHSIVDGGGSPRVTKKSGSSDPMGFDELIAEMRDAPSTRGLFRTQQTGGAGGSSQTGGAGRAANPGQTLLPARELLNRANTDPR